MRNRTSLLLGVALGLCAVPFACRPAERCCSSRGLVSVVVAAADLPAGSAVSLEALSQRAVPEQFVTASVVRPDAAAYLIQRRLQVPVKEGDPLRWTDFYDR